MFSKAARLLLSAPVMFAPGAIAGVLAAIVSVVVNRIAGLDANLLSRLAVDAFTIVVTTGAVACATVMGDTAWRTGTTRLADAARARAPEVIVASGIVAGAGVVAAALSGFTAGLAGVAALFFLLYVMAAAVVGGCVGMAAVRESVDVVLARPMPTILSVAALVIVTVVAGVFGLAISDTPFVGPLIGAEIVQAAVTFVAVIVVGEYRSLRSGTPIA